MHEKPRKFETLEGLRGVASLLVVFQHFDKLLGGPRPQHLYLAVDLFFALSGFVLSYAYQDKLDKGVSTSRFLLTRAVRLWPLYLLGSALGVLTHPALFSVTAPRLVPRFLSVVLNLLFLPGLPQDRGADLYVLNWPAWTLALELLINAVHALFLRRVRTRWVALLAILAGLVLIRCTHHVGELNGGWTAASFLLLGVPRVCFSYFTGMLLYRAWRTGLGRISIPGYLPCLALLIVLVAPAPSGGEGTYLLLVVGVVLPALVLLGAYSRSTSSDERSFSVLGRSSYAVYVLHVPLGLLLEGIWLKISGRSAEAYAPWPGLTLIGILVPLAIWLDRAYDEPLRKKLRVSFGLS